MKKFLTIFLSVLVVAFVIFARIGSGEFNWLFRIFSPSSSIKESTLVGTWNIDNISSGYIYENEKLEIVSTNNTGITVFKKDKTGKTIIYEDKDTVFFHGD